MSLLCLVVLLVSCSKREAKNKVDDLPEIYPDYIGVTVPANICPLNFSVPDAEHVQVVILKKDIIPQKTKVETIL